MPLGLGPEKRGILLLRACFPATDSIVQIALSGWKFKESQTKTKSSHHRAFTALRKGITMTRRAFPWVAESEKLQNCIVGLGSPTTCQTAALGKRQNIHTCVSTHPHTHSHTYTCIAFYFYENHVRVCMIFCILLLSLKYIVKFLLMQLIGYDIFYFAYISGYIFIIIYFS